MGDTDIDGANLWFPPEVELVEVVTFIDRRYLGAITRRINSPLFCGSLMRKDLQGVNGELPTWSPHTLWVSTTDSSAHANDMIMDAYSVLIDRVIASTVRLSGRTIWHANAYSNVRGGRSGAVLNSAEV